LSPTGGPVPPSGLDWRTALVALLAAMGLSLLLLEPALHGPVVSDDLLLLEAVPADGLSAANVASVLDPRGAPVQVTANWAPVHLLVTLLVSDVFGSPIANPYPHHLLNGLLHGVNAVLLAALFVAHGVPLAAALAAGLLFLVHPANAETAAWMFQLKTLLAFGLGIGALLWLPRRPALATGLFALALLSKPSAAAVLAAAIVFEAQRRPAPGVPPRRTPWLLAWGLLLGLYAIPEFAAFANVGEFRQQLPLAAALAQAVAIAGRYVVLALTGWGASTFHQPLPPSSPLDPWFLLGLATLLVFALVSVRALQRGHPAAGWLGLAAAAYLPVAQLFPFRYPMADRYLYFVWPGLIGALLVTLSPWLRAASAAFRQRGLRAAPLALAALVLALPATAAVWAVDFYERAGLWASPERVEYDAAHNYPDGIPGQITLARRLLAEGDVEGAVDAMERARARGQSNPAAIIQDPSLQPLLQNPRYVALVQDMTERWIERAEQIPNPTVSNLMGLAQAQLFLGRIEPAFAAMDRAEAQATPEQRLMIQGVRSEFEQAIQSAGNPTP
jgi:protein O-mannosyl-transferase